MWYLRHMAGVAPSEEPHSVDEFVSMAQWIARATSNREVAGSSPARDFFYQKLIRFFFHLTYY